MKAYEILNEMPYLHPGEMSRHILDNGVSIAAIKRAYVTLGRVGELIVYIDHHSSHVIVIDPGSEVSDSRLSQVFRVQFKPVPLLNFPNNLQNIRQVDKVAVQRAYESQEIATDVYKMLVDRGYTVVSDVSQFEPAQGLWKKVARESGYKTYVADIDHGIFKDANGKDIVYDGTNISDHEIWTSGSDFNGNYRVLILTK